MKNFVVFVVFVVLAFSMVGCADPINGPLPTVDDPVYSVDITEDTVELDLNGDISRSLTVDATSGVTLDWLSYDEDVATVDSNGEITTVGVGTTIIAVEASAPGWNEMDTVAVNVVDTTPVLISLTDGPWVSSDLGTITFNDSNEWFINSVKRGTYIDNGSIVTFEDPTDMYDGEFNDYTDGIITMYSSTPDVFIDFILQ